MTAQAINLHSFPGRGDDLDWDNRNQRAERLVEHPGLFFLGVAERYALRERWGLGIALRFIGSSVTGANLVVADDLQCRAPARLTALEVWGEGHPVVTPIGRVPVDVHTRSQLCDPDVGVLTTTCYTGGGWLFTADEGRTLGLLAEHWSTAHGIQFRGGFVLGLPGWGEVEDRTDRAGSRHQGWRPMLHRPTMGAKTVGGHGLIVEFNEAGRGGRTLDGGQAGHWERGRRGQMLPFRGRIVDLIGPAYAFDGLDTGDLSEHLHAFGLPTLSVPAAVPVEPDAAAHLLAVALSAHRLAVAIDAEAAQWLTTPQDQRDGKATVGLRFMASPGSLAGAALRRSGITPPLRKFAVPDDAALDRWAAAGHGGWTT